MIQSGGSHSFLLPEFFVGFDLEPDREINLVFVVEDSIRGYFAKAKWRLALAELRVVARKGSLNIQIVIDKAESLVAMAEFDGQDYRQQQKLLQRIPFISVEECQQVTLKIRELLDGVQDDLTYTLEVSSPGVFRQLATLGDWVKLRNYLVSCYHLDHTISDNDTKSFIAKEHGLLIALIEQGRLWSLEQSEELYPYRFSDNRKGFADIADSTRTKKVDDELDIVFNDASLDTEQDSKNIELRHDIGLKDDECIVSPLKVDALKNKISVFVVMLIVPKAKLTNHKMSIINRYGHIFWQNHQDSYLVGQKSNSEAEQIQRSWLEWLDGERNIGLPKLNSGEKRMMQKVNWRVLPLKDIEQVKLDFLFH